MPKKEPQQQQQLTPEQDTSAVRALMDTIPAAALGPFVVPLGALVDIDETAAGAATVVEVTDYDGADSYHVTEYDMTVRAYRTVQRVDLATRLQLPADYDPAALVGRTFLVPA